MTVPAVYRHASPLITSGNQVMMWTMACYGTLLDTSEREHHTGVEDDLTEHPLSPVVVFSLRGIHECDHTSLKGCVISHSSRDSMSLVSDMS